MEKKICAPSNPENPVRNQSNEDKKQSKSFKKGVVITVSAVVAVAVVVLVLAFTLPNLTLIASAKATPKYPPKTSFYDYDAKYERPEVSDSYKNSVKDFSASSASVILGGNSENKNALYSPISLFYTLAMSSDGANGATRDEIMDALSMECLGKDEMNSESEKLYRLLYTDNEIGRLRIANSVWLSDKVGFKTNFLNDASKNFYASAYNVDFSSPDTAKKIGKWISENTGGKLGGDFQIDKSQYVDGEPYMELINTIYFCDEWVNKFDSALTEKDTFHSPGGDVTCDFMSHGQISGALIGDGYKAAGIPFKNGEYMLFILPDEGVSPQSIIGNKDTLHDALYNIEQSRDSYDVTFKIPKFSFGSSLDLNSALQKLGINSAFEKSADFSDMINSPLWINNVSQKTYISIDETGCEAAAYTEIGYAGAAQTFGRIDMVLDRPFIFAVMSSDDIPLFIGVVNNPTAE